MNVIRKLMNWSRSKKRGGKARTWARLRLEELEGRIVPTLFSLSGLPESVTAGGTMTITVTDTIDHGTPIVGTAVMFVSGVDAVTAVTMDGVSIPLNIATQAGAFQLNQNSDNVQSFMAGADFSISDNVTENYFLPGLGSVVATYPTAIPQGATNLQYGLGQLPAGGVGGVVTDTFEVHITNDPNGLEFGGQPEVNVGALDEFPAVAPLHDLFNITTSTAHQLAFAPQPTGGNPNVALNSFNVNVLNDPHGTENGQEMTLQLLDPNNTGASLGGTMTAKVVNGVANFKGLTISKEGTYQLTASLPDGSTVTSGDIQIAKKLTWTGKDSASWSDANNWTPSVVPSDDATLIFPNKSGVPRTTTNDISGLTLDGIDLQGSGYVVSGTPVTLGGALINDFSINTYSLDTTLGAGAAINVPKGTLAITSTLSGAGGTPITGAGLLILDGALNESGTLSVGATTRVQLGTATTGVAGAGPFDLLKGAILRGSFANPAYTGAITVETGATLGIGPNNGLGTGTIQFNGGVFFSLNGKVAPVLTNTIILSGDVTFDFHAGATVANVQVTSASTLTSPGMPAQPAAPGHKATSATHVVLPAGSTLSGPGVLTVGAQAGSSYGSSIVEFAGTVNAHVIAGAGTNLILDGTLGSDAIIDVDAKGQTTLSGSSGVQGSGDINVLGGTLVASGASVGYQGKVTLAAVGGTIQVAANNALGTGNLEIDGGTLTNTGKAAVSLGNTLTLGGNATITAKAGLAIAGNVQVPSAVTLTVAGATPTTAPDGVTATGHLLLGASGIVTATGAFTIAGTSAKTLNAVVELAGTVNGNVVAGPGAFLIFDGTFGSQTVVEVPENAKAEFAGTVGVKGSGAVNVSGGTLVGVSTSANFTGAVTSTSGTIQPGANNAFGTGALNLAGGTLQTQGKAAISLDNALTLGSNPVTIDARVAALTFNKTVQAPSAVTVVVRGNLTFGTASAISGAGKLTFSPPSIPKPVGVLATPEPVNVTFNGTVGSEVVGLGVGSSTIVGNLIDMILGGTLASQGVLDVGIGSSLTLRAAAPNASVQGSGAINVLSGGTLLATGSNADYQGAITVTNGYVQITLPTTASATDGVLGTGPLDLESGAYLENRSTVAATLENPVNLNGDSNIVIVSQNETLTFAAEVQVPAATTVSVYGALVLSPTSTLAGPGILTLTRPPAATDGVAVGINAEGPPIKAVFGMTAGGAAAVFQGTINTAVTGSDPDITLVLSGNLTSQGSVDLTDKALGVIGNPDANGSLKGSGTINVTGGPEGATLVAPLANATYDGAISVGAGAKVQVSAADNGLGTGPLVFAGGTLTNTSLGAVTLENPVTLGTSDVVAAGKGLTFANNVLVGASDMLTSTGALLFGKTSVLSGIGAVTLKSSGPAQFDGTINAAVVLSGKTHLLMDGTFGSTGNITVPTSTVLTLGNATTNSAVQGSGAVTVQGGTVSAALANAGFTGSIILTSGVLQVGISDALGSGTLQLNGGTIQTIGTTVITLENALTLGGNVVVSAIKAPLEFEQAAAIASPEILTLTAGSEVDLLAGVTGNGHLTLAGTTGTVKVKNPGTQVTVKPGSKIKVVAI